jgi:hypothetical protein
MVLGGVIASAGIGASYAVLADRIGIDGFAECWCVVEFIDVSVDDNENDKSVADVEYRMLILVTHSFFKCKSKN